MANTNNESLRICRPRGLDIGIHHATTCAQGVIECGAAGRSGTILSQSDTGGATGGTVPNRTAGCRRTRQSGDSEAVGLCRQTVGHWRECFVAEGIHGLEDRPRSGRPARILAPTINEIVRLTTQSTPVAATHWSTRTLAAETQVSFSTIGRIWRVHGLKPHRIESFKLSNDPRFGEKLQDVVPLYLHP